MGKGKKFLKDSVARCSGNSNPEGLVSFNGEIDVFNPNALGQYIQCLAKLGE